MTATVTPTPTQLPQAFIQLPPQPYIAPGLSFPDNNYKFLGVFTAAHLSLCLLISGFGLIVTGLVGVVTRASVKGDSFYAVGVALICFGCFLIAIAIAVFVFAIRWGRKKVHVLERNNPNMNYSNIPISLIPIGFQMPAPNTTTTNTNNNQNNSNTFESFQNLYNGSNAITPATNPYYPVFQTSNNGVPANHQHFMLITPTAPPQPPMSAIQ